MSQTISFSSFNRGTVNLATSYLARAMYSEAVAPTRYDYRDPLTGLSFQLVSSTRALIADPSFPVVKQILDAQWQISYDSTYSGVGKLKFVAQGQDATVAGNWKSINDVLQQYNYGGSLPIVSLAQVYMLVASLKNSDYIVGTLFTPSQPYLELTRAGAAVQLLQGADKLVPFDTVVDSVGLEEVDAAQIVPILTGDDQGKIKLSVAGVYLIEACVGIQTSGAASITDSLPTYLRLNLNGVNVAEAFGAVDQVTTLGDGTVHLTTMVRVKKSNLTANSDNKAVLEVRCRQYNSAPVFIIDSSISTRVAIYFLG
jgi:hypothetical protein